MEQTDIQRYLNKIINRTEKNITNEWDSTVQMILKKVEKMLHRFLSDNHLPTNEALKQIEMNKTIRAMADDVEGLNTLVLSAILLSRSEVFQEGFIRHAYLYDEIHPYSDFKSIAVPSQAVIDKLLTDRTYSLPRTLAKHQETALATIRHELQESVSRGEDYEQTATRVKRRLSISRNSAQRLARLECKKAVTKAKLESAKVFEEDGARMEKMWNCTVDFKTRGSHIHLDGQAVPISSTFKSRGNIGQGPGMFVGPKAVAENINCRCSMVMKVNGIAPSKRRVLGPNGKNMVVDYASFNDFVNRHPDIKEHYAKKRQEQKQKQ